MRELLPPKPNYQEVLQLPQGRSKKKRQHNRRWRYGCIDMDKIGSNVEEIYQSPEPCAFLVRCSADWRSNWRAAGRSSWVPREWLATSEANIGF